MGFHLLIENSSTGNRIFVPLSPSPITFSEKSLCSDVLDEDGRYKLQLAIDGIVPKADSIIIMLNDVEIGECDVGVAFQDEGRMHQLDVRYLPSLPGKYQPFLLHYDMVSFSVRICSGEKVETWFSAFYMCLNSNDTNARDAETMMRVLIEFDNPSINAWVFGSSEETRDIGNSITTGSLRNGAWKSFSSYVQLLEQINACYKLWLPYFRTKASHTITSKEIRVPYNKVRSITHSGFQWLMQNSDQLVPVIADTAILHNEQHYVATSMLSPQLQRIMNTYENQVVLSFLNLICGKANEVFTSLNDSISIEKDLLKKISQITASANKGSPVIAIKKYQLSFFERNLTVLNTVRNSLNALFRQYSGVLECSIIKLSTFPRKTKKFQEINPYSQIFDCIVRWFRFGDFSLEKETMLLKIKTLDKLFEYYCLFTILSEFNEHNFIPMECEDAINSYEYHTDDGTDPNERDVSNTYRLQCDEIEVDIYYQPVLFSYKCENRLSLYRSSILGKQTVRPYYTPDFIIRSQKVGYEPQYIILDSKYSTQATIRNYSLEDALQKYYCQIDSTQTGNKPIAAVWLLQGRAEEDSAPYRYTNTLITQRLSLQILPLRPDIQASSSLWHEISKLLDLRNLKS